MKPRGGTELLYERLMERVPAEYWQGINLITSVCREELIDPTKINVLWQHLSYDQPNVEMMKNKEYIDKIDYFVYVSNWQMEKFRYKYNIPMSKSVVIKNAIEPIPYVKKPEKIKLIYTSTPWRGLEVLIEAYKRLNRDDIELDIYTSTIIYGKEFYEAADNQYQPLYEEAKKLKGVNFMGYATNDVIRQAVQGAHIFAYPSIWEETSCLCAIEAAMAGCSLVTTNYGALYETTADWAKMVPFNTNGRQLVKDFADALNEAIDEFWTDSTQQKLLDQHVYYSNFYNWDKRAEEWKAFLDKIKLRRLSDQSNRFTLNTFNDNIV